MLLGRRWLSVSAKLNFIEARVGVIKEEVCRTQIECTGIVPLASRIKIKRCCPPRTRVTLAIAVIFTSQPFDKGNPNGTFAKVTITKARRISTTASTAAAPTAPATPTTAATHPYTKKTTIEPTKLRGEGTACLAGVSKSPWVIKARGVVPHIRIPIEILRVLDATAFRVWAHQRPRFCS